MNPVERARHEAATILEVPPAEVMAQDMTEVVPWAQRHAIVVAGPLDAQLMFAVGESGELLAFKEPTDVAPLNRFFEVENILLPDGLPPEHLADAIRFLLAGPGGFVASPKFLEAERPDLASWLRPPQEEAEKLFVQHTDPPVLDYDGQRWRLGFHFFNRRGAVERWTVEGEPNLITGASFELALPEWTFRHPYV